MRGFAGFGFSLLAITAIGLGATSAILVGLALVLHARLSAQSEVAAAPA